MEAMPAMMKETTTAGPALLAAAVPVSTKMPVPTISPTPSMVRSSAPSERWSSECCPCCCSTSTLLVASSRPTNRFILSPRASGAPPCPCPVISAAPVPMPLGGSGTFLLLLLLVSGPSIQNPPPALPSSPLPPRMAR